MEDGSLELSENKLKEIDNKQVFNFKTNDKDFWSNNKSDAIEQMKEVFGSGDDAIFEYKDISGDQVEVIHRQSGNSTILNFDIGLDEYKKHQKAKYIPFIGSYGGGVHTKTDLISISIETLEESLQITRIQYRSKIY